MPLGGEIDALVLIARACRSRLFGYFFAVPAQSAPTHGELRALRAEDALVAMLFGGAPIEQARWPILATSLAFDPGAWPFPRFASRGAFGDAWTEVHYDPETLQIVERSAVDPQTVAHLPDARFARAHEAEALLRRLIAGEPAPRTQSVCEVRSPIGLERLQAVAHGGRIQFSTPLDAQDADALARFIEAHPAVQLRVHGFRRGFDAVQLQRFSALRSLQLDVHVLQHANALENLRALQTLRLGAMQLGLHFLESLPQLRELELRGTRAPLTPLRRLHALQRLTLENTPTFDLHLVAQANLQALSLAHGEYDLYGLRALPVLRELELRSLDVTALEALRPLKGLERLQLHQLTHIADLRPLAQLPRLRELHVTGMPQLNVHDFLPLQACAGLRIFEVDVGSRTKAREIYRLMQRGNT